MKRLVNALRRKNAGDETARGTAVSGELQPAGDTPGAFPKASGDYRRYTLVGALVLGIGLGGFIVWAALAPLSGAVVANGEVVLEGYRTTIQHLDGGIVERLPVEEGQRVEQGQTIAEIADNQARSDLGVVESRLLAALGRQARLQAERDGDDQITFPEELSESDAAGQANEIMATQRALFNARRESLETDLSRRGQRIDELEQQINGLEARANAVASQIESFQTEVEERRGLVADQLASKEALRSAERQLNQLRGERGQLRADIAATRAQIATTRMERTLRRQEYTQEVANGLSETQEQILDARSRAIALRAKLERTTITAPVEGFVTGLQVHSAGSVVSPGGKIMDLVPAQRRLLVDVRVPPDRIDDVNVDQVTELSFPSLDSLFVDNIRGRVTSVSADAFSNEQSGERYFLARVRVTPETVDRLVNENFRMTPGMPAQAYINTGSKTLLEYLIKPFSDMLSRAFREG